MFGVAGGARFNLDPVRRMDLVVGPEFWGDSAFRSLFGSNTTAVEGMLTGRIEGTAEKGPKLRLKLGLGAGLDARFGAPEWRMVFGIELFDHNDK